MKNVKRFLYRHLSLKAYLRVVSWCFIAARRFGYGRQKPEFEYLYFLRKLVLRGDVVLDLGANLGYYSRELSRLVGGRGEVHAVEPFPPVCEVLVRNVRRRRNVGVLPCALGDRDGVVKMVNDCEDGYMGTGRNRISDDTAAPLTFEVEVQRGSEIFGMMDRIDFIKCDVEGSELAILTDMRTILRKLRPVCLVETGGENRRKVIALFKSIGFHGYVLEEGELVSVADAEVEKDILFFGEKLKAKGEG